MSGIGAKIGEWYERGYVVYQLVRLLGEHVSSVQWEGIHADERGVDLWITERDGARVACQCKHLKKGAWTWNLLKSESILSYAGVQLARDPIHRYRLVTSVPAADLDDLIASAMRCPDPDRWWQTRDPGPRMGMELAAAWNLDPDSHPMHRATLHDRLRRMEVRIMGTAMVRTACTDGLARLIASTESPATVADVLAELATGWLTTPVGIDRVRQALVERGIRLVTWPGDGRVLTSLDERRRRFLAALEPDDRLPQIPRPALVDQTLAAIDEAGAGRVVVVIGEPGCGKSRVLADTVKRVPGPVLCLSLDSDVLFDAAYNRFCLPGVDGDALDVLRRTAAGARAVVVIDQLDNALWSGAASHPRAAAVKDLLQRWREDPQDLRIVVGCRAVDARASTQLGQWLRHDDHPPIEVPVGDLPETEVLRALTAEGIPATTCDPVLLRLLCRPLLLGLAIRLVRDHRPLHSVASLVGLLRAYWEWVWSRLAAVGRPGDGERWLDALTASMQRGGVLSVSEHDLPVDQPTETHLLSLGVIKRDGDRFRPGHQVLIDYRIAQALVRDQSQLDTLMVTRARQDLAWSGRIRLAVPLLRDAGRFAALASAIESPESRWMFRQAILRALAQDDQPTEMEVDAVIRWLDRDDLRPAVLRDLLDRRPAWVTAVDQRGWIDAAWKRWADQPAHRTALYTLLASVAQTWGDGVARLLGGWRQADPTVLDHAHWAFWHDVIADSDNLFEERLHLAGRRNAQLRPISFSDWTALAEQRPERACRLLAAIICALTGEDLGDTGHHTALYWHEAAQEQTVNLGRSLDHALWIKVQDWWSGLPLRDTGGCCEYFADKDIPTLGTRIGWLLAGALAAGLERGQSTWSKLVDSLSAPLRDADGWLLLRAGAAVRIPTDTLAEEAVRWFMDDRRWACLRLGGIGTIRQAEALPFLSTLVPHLPLPVLAEFEDWLLHYMEPDILRREAYRRHEGEYSHPMLTSHMGETPWRIFTELLKSHPHLRQHLRSTTISQIHCWDVKFGPLPKLYFTGVEFSGVFTPATPIPRTEADSWTMDRWLTEIRSPSLADPRNRWSRPDGQEHTPDTLGHLLFTIATQDPVRFVPLAERLRSTDHEPIRQQFLAALLHAEGQDASPPIGPDRLAQLTELPAWAGPDLLQRWARAAERWPEIPWTPSFISRLESCADTVPSPESTATDSIEQLESARLNRLDTICLRALAAIGQRHATWSESIRQRCLAATGHPELAHRAQGILGYGLLIRSESALLDLIPAFTDPRLGAIHDAWRLIRYLARNRPEAMLPFIAAMVDHADPQVSEHGGFLLGVVRWDGLAVGDRIDQMIDGKPSPAQKGLATALGGLLEHAPLPDWIRDPCLRLANQADRDATWALFRPFHNLRHHPHLQRDGAFVAQLAATTGGIHHGHLLILGFDALGDLRPLSAAILALAERVADPNHAHVGIFSYHTDDLPKLLTRLLEQAERERDEPLRQKTLDALDGLIARGLPQARTWIEVIHAT